MPFAEIARTGSFRQAAKTLHIAQPALNRQIKQLEAALGIYLFDRTPRRLHLTIEGRELAVRRKRPLSRGSFLTSKTQIYLDANRAMREEILAKTLPVESKPNRYRPDDQLLSLLKAI